MVNITFEVIVTVSRFILFAGAGIAMVCSMTAKEDSKRTLYNTEAILCYVLASGV